jgi:hypothetical protein
MSKSRKRVQLNERVFENRQKRTTQKVQHRFQRRTDKARLMGLCFTCGEEGDDCMCGERS